MRGLPGCLVLALALTAGCSLIVDPASEDGCRCGADSYCPDGFHCDAARGECLRGPAPEGADADDSEPADAELEAEPEAAMEPEP